MRLAVLLFLAGALGAAACSGTHEPLQDQAVSAVPQPASDASGLCVPELLSLDIDELSQQLGPALPLPSGFADPILAPVIQRTEQLDSSMLFRRRGLAIVASYDYRSRQVSNLLLVGSNETELMSRAQLQLGADSYLVLPVFKERPVNELLGLRVLAMSLNQ
ncbi:hypothetical protein BEN47_07750 [Hymenobacter lapidarius]|uniref:Uncharacterized protein n=1 Tax=Hymenobacter lapidarius TaxID=1908237 RepID=A0A1G1TEH6_9BACT|nr:hypothetical protein [Hymenobacter lapidarius]OGX89282.1 hypothetical protein BEN47_07750 [Hymenobacter lapidarius]